MQLLKPILFLALFLLFVTLVTVGDSGNASDRMRSKLPETHYGYMQPFANDAYATNNASWRNQVWTPEHYGVTRHDTKANEAILAQFETSGLILDLGEDDNGLKRVDVGDLFLRLSDQDKSRVMQSFAKIVALTDSDFEEAAYAIRHQKTEQILGIYTSAGLQLQ